jgi:hypothetical protein
VEALCKSSLTVGQIHVMPDIPVTGWRSLKNKNSDIPRQANLRRVQMQKIIGLMFKNDKLYYKRERYNIHGQHLYQPK